jgi:signal transduction histidine kinase
MRRQFQVPMAVIAGALLGLIVLLATLQYRWLGQISGAERERMTATLNARATAYALDVDRELTRAYLLFQLDSLQPDDDDAAAVAARHDRWLATSRFPRLVKDIFIVQPDTSSEALPLRRYNPSTRHIEPVAWPQTALPIRKELERPLPSSPSAGGPTSVILRTMVPAVWPSVPALVISSPMLMVSHIEARISEATDFKSRLPAIRHAIVMLDADYMKAEMLPALAQQHFQGTGDGFDYQLAVVPADAAGAPLYHSVPGFTPAPDANVDARVDLFQVRIKDFEPLAAEVRRFATLTALPPISGTRRTHTIYRETVGASAGAGSSGPLSIVVQDAAGEDRQRIDKVIAAGGAASFSARLGLSAPAHWRLLIKHPSGSLERAVNAVRRRNLAISSTILGVLALSVGFLVVSTRRAQALARQQLEFVATVSHELRTPLAVIRSAADNLADGVVHDDDRIRQYGQLVRREGLRLTELVEQTLEYAGLQSGQRTITARPVEVGRLLREVTAAAPAGMTMDVQIADNLPAVAGDEAALRRVFQNLVGNAIKYGAEGRWVGVTATFSASTLEVRVSDRGIGIAAADQGRVFDPFYRAPDVVAAQIQGAGLGLSLVKRIVEAHAGRITLKSAPGEGSTFTVALPVLHGDAAGVHDRVADAPALPS